MKKNEKKQIEIKNRSQIVDVWRRLRRSKTAMIGLVIISIFLVFLIFADFIADYDELVISQNIEDSLMKPGAKHIMGADFYGRDIFARIVHGSRTSLSVAIICITFSTVIGTLVGAGVGYYGGKIDEIVMRVLDAVSAIPGMLLTLSLVAVLGPGVMNLIIALIICDIPNNVRLVRSAVLSVTNSEYIEAAKSYGAKPFRIICKYILPNAMGPIIVNCTMGTGFLIINIAGLSFLGMGIQPPIPEWGYMLSEGREFMRSAPHVILFPGLAIMLSALSLNLLGDGLRDALDPRLKN